MAASSQNAAPSGPGRRSRRLRGLVALAVTGLGGRVVNPDFVPPANLPVAQAQYRAVVIGAFQNVADTLRALQSDARGVAAPSAAERATNESLGLIRKQYGAGALNSTQVLIAPQSYLSALATSAGARANQYADTAALFQALGGGW